MPDLYLDQLHRAHARLDSTELGALLTVDPNQPRFIQLRQHLLTSPHLRPTSYRDLIRTRFPQPPLRPFADYIACHLLYVRDVPLGLSETELERAYTLLEDLYKTADRLFATAENGWFVPTLRVLTRRLISVALAAGRASRDSKLTRAGEAARMLARPMGIAASDRSGESSAVSGVPAKRTALYFLANSTFEVYFALKNLRLCDTVLNNVNNSNVSIESNEFSRLDQVQFWYYRGRIHLYQRRLGLARKDLGRSFEQCLDTSWKNARLILIYLVTASIPLGYLPKYDLLQHFNLLEQFGPALLQPLRKGNWKGVLTHLSRYREWLLHFGNYLLLREKLEVVCWRNLARQTLLVSTNGNPVPATGPPTLSLSLLLQAARIAWDTSSLEPDSPPLDEDDLECIAVSLMDQGYLKAYILHSKRLLVLQKGEKFGFLPVSSVG